MKKLVLILFLCIFSLPTFAYANNTGDKVQNKLLNFEITNPKEEATIVPSSNIVLTGVGVDKDKLDIEVYSVKRTVNKDKELVIKKLNNSYSLTIDSLKLFAQELELKEGENLIAVNLTRNDKKYVLERTVNYNKNMQLNTIIRQLDYKEAGN